MLVVYGWFLGRFCCVFVIIRIILVLIVWWKWFVSVLLKLSVRFMRFIRSRSVWVGRLDWRRCVCVRLG